MGLKNLKFYKATKVMIRGIITVLGMVVFCLTTSAQPNPVFESKTIDFGTVVEGTICKYSFKFKNMGNEPFLITYVSVTCGCTVPRWSKEPVMPGDTSSVYIEFDTHNKMGSVAKGVNLTNNSSDPLIGFIILANVVVDSNFKATIDSTSHKFIKLIDQKNFFQVIVPVDKISKKAFRGTGRDLERIVKLILQEKDPSLIDNVWYNSNTEKLEINTYNIDTRNSLVTLLNKELSSKKKIKTWTKKIGV